MPEIVKARYELISDLNVISRLRPLRDLIWQYSRYHAKPADIPTASGLAQSGYRALVYEELTEDDEYWRIALLFRIGREKKALWHTIISIDYVLIDPSTRITFTKLSSCIRLISQFALKHLKASCIDLLINLDTQSNPAIKRYLTRSFINEGLKESESGSSCAKRLKALDENGKNVVSLPLPNVAKSAVKGLNPYVQKTISPQKTNNGEKVIFVGRIKSSSNHRSILEFCVKHAKWMNPPLTMRSSYMQTTFNDMGDIRAYVESLIQDAHFIITLDSKNHITGFMAFIVGFSLPYLSTMDKGAFTKPSDLVSPERTIYVPAVVCRSVHGGRWTREGFQQALSLWKMLFTIIRNDKNKSNYDLIGSMVDEGGVHSQLLETLGFTRKSVLSNLPWHARKTSIYSRPI